FNGMANGQGASMALPIYGIYASKVYADPTLPYSQDEKFVFPDTFNPCKKEFYELPNEEAPEEAIEGVFD
ncbi:MAG: hypothetical protein K2J74_04625, partial [Muribaculaceae bacterium]|nr:hypothetical protein [Muribaculaceae bacterium]